MTRTSPAAIRPNDDDDDDDDEDNNNRTYTKTPCCIGRFL